MDKNGHFGDYSPEKLIFGNLLKCSVGGVYKRKNPDKIGVKIVPPTVQFSNHFIPDLTRLANLMIA